MRAKFGEGHGQEPLTTQQGDGAQPLVQQDEKLYENQSLFSVDSTVVAAS